MTYIRKTVDEWDIEANYGYGDGWEVVSTETNRKDALENLRLYRSEMSQYPHRLRKHRVKKDTHS